MTYDYSDLPPILASYLRNLRVVKNRSSKTVYEYAVNLRMFSRFLAGGKRMNITDVVLSQIDISHLDEAFYDAVTLDDAYTFLAYCADQRQMKEAARCRMVSAIRSFYKYLYLRKYTPHIIYFIISSNLFITSCGFMISRHSKVPIRHCFPPHIHALLSGFFSIMWLFIPIGLF